ncbi:hypothetical protein HNY73_003672 [Argiope bruennichi]|uniref:Uncharacterized protein n=1 Tax=Argiope bruennichi TaxID=94029 RepID=A0A8T0FRB1_ARGBR|nr:hypothetical protein HNY73_003672 [Argiope bruennichi]
MALSSYWISQNRKDLAERAIVSKREKDAVRASKCMEVDSYHRQLALKSAKYRSLEEVQGLKTSKLGTIDSSRLNNMKSEIFQTLKSKTQLYLPKRVGRTYCN